MNDANGIRAVVVSHCSASTIGECLRRLLAAPEVVEIVVIDNGSDDDTVACAMPFVETEARVTLRADPENPGFATACNAGALRCAQPWLAFVNPDCLVEPDTFTRLLARASEVAGIGAIGCSQLDADGVEDPAVRRRDPSLWKLLFAGGARGALHVVRDGDALQRVDALSGALMLVPTAVFAKVDGFDPGYRLHVEDLDLCRRIRGAGFTVCVANEVSVKHVRGVSTRRRPLWVEWQKHRGMWRYFRKFEAAQTSPPARAVLCVALWAHWLVAAPRAWLRARTGAAVR